MFQLLCKILSHVEFYLYIHIVNLLSMFRAAVHTDLFNDTRYIKIHWYKSFPVFVGRYRSVTENNVIVDYPSSAYCDVCKIETTVINF